MLKKPTYKQLVGLGIIIFVSMAFLNGCTTTQPQASVPEKKMTLGIVQKEIRKGMSQAEVISALGSPNILTRDAEGKETWVYDKIATEASYSKKGGYGTILILGFAAESAKASSSQRTLTVVIKFDQKQLVENFAYHVSKF